MSTCYFDKRHYGFGLCVESDPSGIHIITHTEHGDCHKRNISSRADLEELAELVSEALHHLMMKKI